MGAKYKCAVNLFHKVVHTVISWVKNPGWNVSVNQTLIVKDHPTL